MNPTACFSCKGQFPDIAGPVHRYMDSSPGCWAAYGEVMTREYSDRAYNAGHRYSVDAYAAQHPGRPSPQSINSVAVHLCSLCSVFEFDGQRPSASPAAAGNLAAQGFHWLTPPEHLGAVTVADVVRAQSPEAHRRLVRDWAFAVWSAWSAHHATIRQWLTVLDHIQRTGKPR